MKRLTEEELADIKRYADWFAYNDGSPISPESAVSMVDEIARSRALLKRIDSGAQERGSQCPACGAYRAAEQHDPGCELAALIGGGS